MHPTTIEKAVSKMTRRETTTSAFGQSTLSGLAFAAAIYPLLAPPRSAGTSGVTTRRPRTAGFLLDGRGLEAATDPNRWRAVRVVAAGAHNKGALNPRANKLIECMRPDPIMIIVVALSCLRLVVVVVCASDRRPIQTPNKQQQQQQQQQQHLQRRPARAWVPNFSMPGAFIVACFGKEKGTGGLFFILRERLFQLDGGSDTTTGAAAGGAAGARGAGRVGPSVAAPDGRVMKQATLSVYGGRKEFVGIRNKAWWSIRALIWQGACALLSDGMGPTTILLARGR
jgi:hypothetical protein